MILCWETCKPEKQYIDQHSEEIVKFFLGK
jgi:hypothetical protein